MNHAVNLEIRGPVGWIALSRPDKLNAINDELLTGLRSAIAAVEENANVRAVVLFGQGRAFSAGGDINTFANASSNDFEESVTGFMDLAKELRACSKPIIAALHGFVLAGGFELAMNCDIRIAAKGTSFGLPDAPIGLTPTSGMSHSLPRLIGLGRAIYLSLSADCISAEEAERIGLVSKVVDREDLMSEVERLADRLAAFPRTSVKRTKALYYDAMDMSFTAAIATELQQEIACFECDEVKSKLKEFATRKEVQRSA